MSDIATKLDEARALIERGWCQEFYAVGKSGRPVDEYGRSAVCFCAKGAIHRTCGDIFEAEVVEEALGKALPDPPKWKDRIAYFNDAPERTQAEVIEAFRKAAELARASS